MFLAPPPAGLATHHFAPLPLVRFGKENMAGIVSALAMEALPELFTERQVVAADQAFHRRLAEYEMNIEQQKLFREDIRDLVELTVGRMDVYHLVGALLLEFCINFYCENHMFDKDAQTPSFILSFFLLANLSGIGFLLLSVWLSMHASVASHSVGVRLLTSFLRLSIPSRQELEDVARAPLLPMMERFLALGKRMGLAGSSAQGQPAGPDGASNNELRSAALGHPGGRMSRVSLPAPLPEVPGIAENAALQQGALAVQDREYHFRRFLKEQQRWLCYDAYARVAMALGINQMLTAMSYFLVGSVLPKAPRAAPISLLGVQWLSMLLLRLDITEAFQTRKGKIMMLLSVPLPPLYAAIVLHFLPDSTNPNSAISWWAAPGYILHASWLVFVSGLLWTNSGDDIKALPKQLRTVLYLDVLNLEQHEAAQAVKEQERKDVLRALSIARRDLEAKMHDIVEEESASGRVSAVRRVDETRDLEAQLREELRKAKELPGLRSDPDARAQRREAETTLDHLAVWRRAPEILATLAALRRCADKQWLDENAKKEIETAYQDFLQRCKDLDLGLCAEDNGEPSCRYSGAERPALVGLAISPEEEPAVRVEDWTSGYLPSSVWIAASGGIRHSAPNGPKSTSFNTTMTQAIPEFTTDALHLKERLLPTGGDLMESELSFYDRSNGDGSFRRHHGGPGRRLNHSASASGLPPERPLLPATATPPDQLPGVIVRSFALGMAFLWVVSAGAHLIHDDTSITASSGFTSLLEFSPVAVDWPAPASMFRVQFLHCSEASGRVLIGGEFALYEAQQEEENLSHFTEVLPREVHSVMCDGRGQCHGVQNSELYLIPLADHQPREQFKVRVPHDWRRFTASWSPRNGSTEAVLAGWDGTRVLVGTVRLTEGYIRPRLALRPRMNSCLAATGDAKSQSRLAALGFVQPECQERLSEEGNFTDVRALQLADDGQTLFLLHGRGLLDRWDLVRGELEASWRIPHDHRAKAVAFCVRPAEDEALSYGELLVALGSVNASLAAARLPRAALMSELSGCHGVTADNHASESVLV